jgi:hypothetical protein
VVTSFLINGAKHRIPSQNFGKPRVVLSTLRDTVILHCIFHLIMFHVHTQNSVISQAAFRLEFIKKVGSWLDVPSLVQSRLMLLVIPNLRKSYWHHFGQPMGKIVAGFGSNGSQVHLPHSTWRSFLMDVAKLFPKCVHDFTPLLHSVDSSCWCRPSLSIRWSSKQ